MASLQLPVCAEMVLPGREKCVDADHYTLRNMLTQTITR